MDEESKYRERFIRFAGTDDYDVVIQKVSRMTGWKNYQIWRWPADYLDDVICVLLSEKVQSDQRKARALFLANEGMTWPEIAELIDGDRSGWKALSQEIQRYSEKTGKLLKERKSGRRPKS